MRPCALVGALSFALLALTALFPPLAAAGDIEDFQAARAAYEAHDWQRAITAFESLVGGETPRLRSQPLVLESRKYLAAAYLFAGRRDAAATQLERLLREEPTYELDPLQFPIEVIELFAAVRDELAEDRRIAEERAAAEAHAADQRARVRRLVEWAREPVEIRVETSRWLAALPFGVGQFENGDEGLGAFFLVSEGVLLLTSGILLAVWIDVVNQVSSATALRDSVLVASANSVLEAVAIADWVTVGALVVLIASGIGEAQASFRGERVVRQERDIPPDLLDGLELGVGPGGVSLTLHF